MEILSDTVLLGTTTHPPRRDIAQIAPAVARVLLVTSPRAGQGGTSSLVAAICVEATASRTRLALRIPSADLLILTCVLRLTPTGIHRPTHEAIVIFCFCEPVARIADVVVFQNRKLL
jgi:hypothetical protein